MIYGKNNSKPLNGYQKAVNEVAGRLAIANPQLLSNRAPDKPSSKSFSEIVAVLEKHLSPKPLVIAQRFRFHKRNQMEGENINTYVAELKKLSQHCQFGESLNDALRDRLVCGLITETIQKRLLSEADLTLSKAMNIAVAMETAAKDTLELRGKETEVNKLATKPAYQKYNRDTKPHCDRCNSNYHNSPECWSKDEKCRRCGKVGHIQRACRAKMNHPEDRTKKEQGSRVHQFNIDENDKDEEDGRSLVGSLEVHEVKGSNDGIIWITPKVDKEVIKMELDTGSAVTVLPAWKYKELWNDRPLKDTDVILRTYSGERIKPAGKATVQVEYGDQRK
ncbi:hypothetical protein QZH41_019573 [Actinostola sp. cb2023]|nr:hypothetical protein QZH41_019573 [Actinostola sp. cb2023]